METALHCKNFLIAQLAEDEFSTMPFDCGYWKVRDAFIADLILVGYFIDKASQSRT
jgi:hypothetical protein